MFNIASTMTDVVSFTVGEPDFVTPQNIIDASLCSSSSDLTHGFAEPLTAIRRSLRSSLQ
jgi:aspartate/methionine/tyrosine aminotransferase